MSEINEKATQEAPTKPTPGHDSEELQETELEKVSGGRRISLNPQPLPPYQGF